ncbi:hypothetical protein GCK72_022509 [Caenorhabditis remanei]|uniref:Uncharacterized protein n=2 Tax=Caenorhabditis remanei TaxID=31234 RepID=E3N4Y2_CAERE|nr:hypothetical protein GCK72_022509 [Caenorhabditis remanei]EFO86933.1 hypothetical protein CRE_09738 [Caenorhabditis remanei]KAF1746058.1 hypothetical protein GCK72_022509 [Caenorhabditis remanei]
MRRRTIVIRIILCHVTPILLYLLGSYAPNRFLNYDRSEEEKVKDYISTTQLRETIIQESEEEDVEDIERITASTMKVPEEWTTTTTIEPTSTTTGSFTTTTVAPLPLRSTSSN